MEKGSSTFHKLLPARLSNATQDQLCEMLTKLANYEKHYEKAIARFKKGWIFAYNYDAFAILVLGKSDLNTTTLNLVLKSAVSSLETTFGQRRATAGNNFKFVSDHAAILVRAVNLCAAFFQGRMSRFEIAEILRQAKSQLMNECPSLKQFTVDANGGVILIKGAEKNMDEFAVEAAARLVLTRLLHLAHLFHCGAVCQSLAIRTNCGEGRTYQSEVPRKPGCDVLS